MLGGPQRNPFEPSGVSLWIYSVSGGPDAGEVARNPPPTERAVAAWRGEGRRLSLLRMLRFLAREFYTLGGLEALAD